MTKNTPKETKAHNPLATLTMLIAILARRTTCMRINSNANNLILDFFAWLLDASTSPIKPVPKPAFHDSALLTLKGLQTGDRFPAEHWSAFTNTMKKTTIEEIASIHLLDVYIHIAAYVDVTRKENSRNPDCAATNVAISVANTTIDMNLFEEQQPWQRMYLFITENLDMLAAPAEDCPIIENVGKQ